MEGVKKYTKIILNIMIPIFGILLVCLLGPKLLRFFLPFVIGWIIAMIANPLVRFLDRRLKILRKHSSVIIVVAVLVAVIGVGYFIVSRLVIQAISLAKDLPSMYQVAVAEIQAIFFRFDTVFQALPLNVQESWKSVSNNIGQYISLLVQTIASPTVEVAGNVAKGIPSALVSTIVTILSSYFFIVERDKIIDFWKSHLPKNGSKYYRYLKGDVKHLIGGYFLAQFRIMFVVGVILIIGFFILGVSYSLLLGVLVAMLDFLPIFGTGTVLIPWGIIKLLAGDYPMAIGLILLYVLSQVVRQVIQPKIVGDSMGLPPLMTLLFLYLGFKLHGISGMILAVPFGVLVLNLYKYGAFDSLIDHLRILVRDVNRFRREKDGE